eukprot:6504175-Prymnesium_polylepis.1
MRAGGGVQHAGVHAGGGGARLRGARFAGARRAVGRCAARLWLAVVRRAARALAGARAAAHVLTMELLLRDGVHYLDRRALQLLRVDDRRRHLRAERQPREAAAAAAAAGRVH